MLASWPALLPAKPSVFRLEAMLEPVHSQDYGNSQGPGMPVNHKSGTVAVVVAPMLRASRA
jgi:hypothetical protein